ncbi:hypothetical protein SAMN05421630_102132 [Prauserella marina]|uniref:Uncharacterized protein n=1 Tax=Prauserella marina TaxID=530584 RepID=A0A1G6LMK8_9PSEU|nr:hypothetical protein DES30_1011860 [Prauserella marina]SDC44463.1 hypothetical protein SAMN05421630_102132 [Prauserella marina]
MDKSRLNALPKQIRRRLGSGWQLARAPISRIPAQRGWDPLLHTGPRVPPDRTRRTSPSADEPQVRARPGAQDGDDHEQ